MKKLLKLRSALWLSLVISTPALAQITGSGTNHYIPKFTGSSSIGNSLMYQASGTYIGIGTTGASSRLHIQSTGSTYSTSGFRIDNNGGSQLLLVKDDGGVFSNGYVDVTTTASASGATISYYSAMTGSSSYHAEGTRSLVNVSNSATNTGIYGDARGSSWENIGGYFTGTGSGNSSCYGVLATGSGGSTNYAGYFIGNVYTTGSYSSSDIKLKKDIQPMDNALSRIMQLKPKTYFFKTNEYKQMNLPAGQQMGLIAQELETVFPELVAEHVNPALRDEKANAVGEGVKFKAVNYTGLVPVLVAGMQDQQSQISELRNQVNELKAAVAKLSGSAPENPGQTISGLDLPVLEQNNPNPFSETTTIGYYLPANSVNAKISIVSEMGEEAGTYAVSGSGKGRISIAAGSLKPGTYSYQLTVNGRVADSKKMLLVK